MVDKVMVAPMGLSEVNYPTTLWHKMTINNKIVRGGVGISWTPLVDQGHVL